MIKNIAIICTLFLVTICTPILNAQNYHAVNGSPYAGVLANFVNPASGAVAPFNWDLSVMGGQSNTINNGVAVTNLTLSTLASNLDKLKYTPTVGNKSRSLDNNADFHLLNIRYSLDNKTSVSFGMRVRTYNHISATPFVFVDTINNFTSFLHYNAGWPAINLSGYDEAWFETDLTYAKVFKDNEDYRLAGGVTLGILKGLSGVYAGLNNATYKEVQQNNVPQYNSITGGSLAFLYSENYSALDSQYHGSKNLQRFKAAAKRSASLSLGVEYTVKKHIFEEEDNPLNYALKVGVSIMDLGFNRYNTNHNAFLVQNPNASATDTGITNQLGSSATRENIKRVLENNFTASVPLKDKFTMALPTRLVITVDKPLWPDLYINGMISINFYSSDVADMYKIRATELNRLIITPRWETEYFGLYFPTQYTINKEIMLGAAFKFGPFIMGLHNINWLQKGKAEELNGGGYFALHITPGIKKHHHSLDCYDTDY